MKILSVSLGMSILCLSAFFSSEAGAFVAQSASSAMRGDNFVGSNETSKRSSSSSSSTSSRQAERQRQAEEAERRRKAVHDRFANPQKKEVPATSAPTPAQKAPEADSQADAPVTSTGSATEYNKKYASRFFKTISGYITIEQQNIPKRIAIGKGSSIELQLDGEENAFWFVTINEDVLKVEKNKRSGDKTIVVLKAINAGGSRVVLDYISTKTSNYKVLMTKKFNIIVDE